MKESFWTERWDTGTTPWDLGKEHPRLHTLTERLESHVKLSGPVLVPGCGAGHAASFFDKKGVDVVAFDFVEKAIEQARSIYPHFNDRQLRVADALDVKSFSRGTFQAVYDRAMLCAISVESRRKYLSHCRRWLQPHGWFIGFVFTQRRQDPEKGPPFQILPEQLMDLMEGLFHIEEIEENDYIETEHIIVKEAMIVARATQEDA